MKNLTLVKLPTRYSLSPAQVVLIWLIAGGWGVIPKSSNPEHIKENFDLNFTLSDQHMSMLNSLERDICEKYTWDPASVL